jgi:hypothetical protein
LKNTAFDFNTIEKFALSPGDIFWIKKSGEEVLVSKKGEVPNSLLCKKLLKNENILQMKGGINVEVISRLEECFTNSKKEYLVQNKKNFRNEIITILYAEYINIERSQFEFDIMVWKIFSTFSSDDQAKFVEIDIELFKRSLRVTSSLVIGAFLIGYYDESFLEKLFSRSMNLLMKVVTSEAFSTDLQNLEMIRENIDFVCDISEEVKLLFDPKMLNSEISSWEKLLIVFNRQYSFLENTDLINIVYKLSKGQIEAHCNEVRTIIRTLNLTNKTLELSEIP